MKYFIASDIHGSLYFCEKMLASFEKEKADKLVLLGDILYHGPRNDLPKDYAPKKVIELLNPLKNQILAVRGNCDTEVDQMVLSFPVLADYAIISEKERLIYITHLPKCTEHEDYVYMNPGSVSIPKEESHHGYMILEDGVFLWKDFDGNILREYSIR